MMVRERLRTATAAAHERLHRAMPFARIADGGIDRASYADLLESLHAFHARLLPLVEAGCHAIDAQELVAVTARRVDLLRDDLATLGRAPEPVSPAIHERFSPQFLAGCAYTVQGSTLGGKIIHRQLDPLLTTDAGRMFFLGSSNDGTSWRLLCDRLEDFGNKTRDIGAVVCGASYAFAYFAACLQKRSQRVTL